MDLPILDISYIILKSFFFVLSKLLFYKKNGLLLLYNNLLQTKQVLPSNGEIRRQMGALTPPERSCPTLLTSPRSGAGPATSHTDCRFPARGCRCPWPRGSAWRNTASADPARTSQRFLSEANAQNLVQLINLFISLSS